MALPGGEAVNVDASGAFKGVFRAPGESAGWFVGVETAAPAVGAPIRLAAGAVTRLGHVGHSGRNCAQSFSIVFPPSPFCLAMTCARFTGWSDVNDPKTGG